MDPGWPCGSRVRLGHLPGHLPGNWLRCDPVQKDDLTGYSISGMPKRGCPESQGNLFFCTEAVSKVLKFHFFETPTTKAVGSFFVTNLEPTALVVFKIIR
jgi:hypothetical protein